MSGLVAILSRNALTAERGRAQLAVLRHGPSHAYGEDVLLSPRAVERGLFDPTGVRRLFEEHMAGRDHTLGLAILLGLELWHRQFVDGDPAPALGAGAGAGYDDPVTAPAPASIAVKAR